MAWVTLRQFTWTERTLPSGTVEVDEFFSARDTSTLPVDISELVYINALAPAGTNRVKYATRAHELALITTFLESRPNNALALKNNDFRSSSLHIKSFVTESMGLGMLTATVEALYRWNTKNQLHSFDALPTALAFEFARRGPRPDLLFDFGNGRLAGEARGRSATAPQRPGAEPRKRLDSLIRWSRAHGDHDITMTWAYLTAQGVTVDIYWKPGRTAWLPDNLGKPPPPEPTPLWLPDQLELRSSDSPRSDTAPRPTDPATPDQLVLNARQNLELVAEALFETAPISGVRFAGVELRGEWLPADVLGETSGALLLGLLPESLSAEHSGGLTADLRGGDRFAATVRGRFVVMYAPDENDQPWHLLEPFS